VRGRYGSGGLGRACSVWVGFGDAGEGDLEAEGAELADVVGDLTADVALAVVVVRAEVGVAHAGVSQQLGGLQLGVPGGDACFGRAASSGQPPVAGAFAGLGAAGRHGGLAEDCAQVPVALLGFGASGALAGLVVLRGAAAPGDQVRAGAEPGHVHAGFGDGTQPQITAPAEDYLHQSASPYTLPALIDALGQVTDQLSRAERQALSSIPPEPPAHEPPGSNPAASF
jgi:hypothetical protein